MGISFSGKEETAKLFLRKFKKKLNLSVMISKSEKGKGSKIGIREIEFVQKNPLLEGPRQIKEVGKGEVIKLQ